MLAAIFLLALIEMTFSPGRSACSGGHGDIEKVPRERTKRKGTAKDQARAPARPTLPTVVEGSSPLRDLGPLYGRRSSFSRTLVRLGEQSEQLDQMEMAQREQRAQEPETDDTSDSSSSENSQGPFTLTKEQKHRRAVMQCNLLEMGILFHSVFIGMSLSVSIGSEFVVLLIAIIFHRKYYVFTCIFDFCQLTEVRNVRRSRFRRPNSFPRLAGKCLSALDHGFHVWVHVRSITRLTTFGSTN